MKQTSGFSRFLLSSPYLLLLFLLLPGLLVAGRVLRIALPFSLSTGLLLGNNLCLLAALLARVWWYASRLPRGSRYDGGPSPSAVVIDREEGSAAVRAGLEGAGFRFDAGGSYGERPDLGFLGTTLLYGGLFLLLFVGTADNLRQLSGTVIKGPGAPVDLSLPEKYYHLVTGPLASPRGLPFLKVLQQNFPNASYPLGATEIRLYDRDGNRLGAALIDAAKGPYRYGECDYYLNSLLADVALTIRTRESIENNVFDDAVKVRPLYEKAVGDFTMYGTFATPSGEDGEVYYDPAHGVFRIALARQGKKVLDTDYHFQAYRQKEDGPYVVGIKGMGHWSELHVVRRRHMPVILAGGVVALFGLLLRIAFRPQRVWLEEHSGRCRVRCVGALAPKALRG